MGTAEDLQGIPAEETSTYLLLKISGISEGEFWTSLGIAQYPRGISADERKFSLGIAQYPQGISADERKISLGLAQYPQGISADERKISLGIAQVLQESLRVISLEFQLAVTCITKISVRIHH
jgi:hypothetical protein